MPWQCIFQSVRCFGCCRCWSRLVVLLCELQSSALFPTAKFDFQKHFWLWTRFGSEILVVMYRMRPSVKNWQIWTFHSLVGPLGRQSLNRKDGKSDFDNLSTDLLVKANNRSIDFVRPLCTVSMLISANENKTKPSRWFCKKCCSVSLANSLRITQLRATNWTTSNGLWKISLWFLLGVCDLVISERSRRSSAVKAGDRISAPKHCWFLQK